MSLLESTRRLVACLLGTARDKPLMPPRDRSPELRDLTEVAFFLEAFAAFLRAPTTADEFLLLHLDSGAATPVE